MSAKSWIRPLSKASAYEFPIDSIPEKRKNLISDFIGDQRGVTGMYRCLHSPDFYASNRDYCYRLMRESCALPDQVFNLTYSGFLGERGAGGGVWLTSPRSWELYPQIVLLDNKGADVPINDFNGLVSFAASEGVSGPELSSRPMGYCTPAGEKDNLYRFIAQRQALNRQERALSMISSWSPSTLASMRERAKMEEPIMPYAQVMDLVAHGVPDEVKREIMRIRVGTPELMPSPFTPLAHFEATPPRHRSPSPEMVVSSDSSDDDELLHGASFFKYPA